MTDYLTTDTELTSVANAIRTKGDTSEQLTYPAGFVSAIEALPTEGGSSDRVIKPIVQTDIIYNAAVCIGNDFAPTEAIGTVGATMRIETRVRHYILDTLTRGDTGDSIPYTQVSPIFGGYTAYEFTMPDADVSFNLIYND